MLTFKVVGLDKAIAAMQKMGSDAAKYLNAAGVEAGEEIIQSPGLAIYPPEGPGNQPPAPYYIRGRGTQYASGKNDGRSERLGTQFTVQSNAYGVTIGNRSSYAEHVVGERQARVMGRIGWARLIDVAQQKLPAIAAIYQKWLDKLVEDAGL